MEKYEFHLVREMYQTAEVIRHLDVEKIGKFAEKITGPNIFATGEGSSRLFPSKKARYDSLKNGYDHAITSEGSTQALEYDLSSFTIVAVSNSGRTKEVVRLLESLRDSRRRLPRQRRCGLHPVPALASAQVAGPCDREMRRG